MQKETFSPWTSAKAVPRRLDEKKALFRVTEPGVKEAAAA
jgi:hypothetical protein